MLIGQTIGTGANRFEVERELGSGAMGTVYRAKFHRGDKIDDVALKVVALGLLGNEGAMARFEREAAILKQLRHPHIVKLWATGHYRKTPFIAMEFVDGEPLDRVLARRGRLGWEEVAHYGKQLCEALQYAHERGIIHRDLKPSNLMIASDGNLKLTDFGIAKDTDVTALTGANSTIGTAAYMSPEQCKGDRNLTARSDLYSLGIVFFELLSGRKPFTAESTVDMFLKHVNDKPPRIGKIVQDLPPKFETLILQLLEKDKNDRPADAAWVARMLGEVEEDLYARKSAGLEAATARKTDRPRGSGTVPVTEADRDAARALKGVKKKKRKREAVPWYRKPAVSIAGIVLGLAAIIGVVYFATRPPSPEVLAAAIDPAKPAESAPAAEAYLRRYGDQPGPATDTAAKVFREAKSRERQRQLSNRFGTRWKDKPDDADDPEAYSWAMLALQAERDGRVKDAADWWAKVKGRFPEEAALPFTFDEAKLAKARWGWVADDHLRELEQARTAGRELDTRIADSRRFERPIPYDPTSPESVATKARRLEQPPFTDADKAGRLWDTVIGLTEKNPNQRGWFLVASEHRAALPKDAGDNATGKRVKIVQDRLRAIEERIAAKPASRLEWIALRAQCRDLIELYEDETEPAIVQAVSRAKQIREETKD